MILMTLENIFLIDNVSKDNRDHPSRGVGKRCTFPKGLLDDEIASPIDKGGQSAEKNVRQSLIRA